MPLRIAVVGAGAMGSLFGALLSEAGHEVALLDIRAELVEAINAGGLSIEREGETRRVACRAFSNPAGIEPGDLAIVFVKSNDTAEAAQSAARLLAPGGLTLTLQNGMGNADILAKSMDPGQVVAGTTAHGATLLGPGNIRHAGAGHTTIGFWAGGPLRRAEELARAFTTAGIETEAVADIKPVVWEKLLVNVGINAITALTNIKNGQLLDREATRELARAAVEEAGQVARAKGVSLRPDMVGYVFQVAEATGSNRSSMGQDVDSGRLTEIKAINGAVVRMGAEEGVATPVNFTLAALVETLESHYPAREGS